jgi:antitoxin HicB
MSERSIGTSLDAFLEEEGSLGEAQEVALKRVLAWQIAEAMKSQHLSQTEMARRMKTSRAQLRRLLDPGNTSVTLHTLHRAAVVLGKQVVLDLVDAPAGKPQAA